MTAVDLLFRELTDALAGSVEREVSIAPFTTYRVGGPAALLVIAQSPQDIIVTAQCCRAHGIDFIVVGGGSNLLVADSGYEGVVLILGESLATLEVDEHTLTAGGACRLSSVVKKAEMHALSGLEFAAGIPGTVGGAIAMNAGTRSDWIGSRVESVDVVDLGSDELKQTTLYGPDIEWGYRSSSIRGRSVVVSVKLGLTSGRKEAISAEMATLTERRRSSQPLTMRNAGSVFKNPTGDSAGRLIEAAGLKGLRCGEATVSMVHGNFIVTDEGARASDVYSLIQLVREKVMENSGIELETEIQIVGTFQ